MAKLICSMEGNFIDEFALDKNRLTIGRRPNNDIHIDNLAISGEHAVIITIGNDSFLEDIGSTNGTLVNGKVIKKHVLQHGDVIEFGKFQLKYVNDAAAEQAANGGIDDFEKTMVIRPIAKPANSVTGAGSVPLHSASINPSSVPFTMPPVLPAVSVSTSTQPLATEDASKPMQILNQPITIRPIARPQATTITESLDSVLTPTPTPTVPDISTAPINNQANITGLVGHIQVLTGASAGKELMLNKALTTLGKPGVQVAVITKRPLGYFITHVEGKVHPIVNGKSAGAQALQLNDNDVIELAGVKMQFYLFKSA